MPNKKSEAFFVEHFLSVFQNFFFKHNDGILFYFTIFVLFFMKKTQKEI
jgi:hypothetical protein